MLRDRQGWRDAGLVALLALAVAAYGLTAKSLWLDEAVSADFARTGFRDLLPVLTGGDPNMALYYLLLNIWRRLFGDGEAAMRAPSVIATAVSAGAITLLGRRLFTRGVGLLAGVMLASHALILWFAQTARAYAFVVLFAVLATTALVAELERPSIRARLSWIVTGAALVYLHYLGALVLVAHGCYVLLCHRRVLRDRARLLSVAVLALLLIPAVLAALRGGTARIDWIDPPTVANVAEVLRLLGGHSLPLFLLLVALGAIAAMSKHRPRRVDVQVGDAVQPHMLLGCWLFVPLGLTLVLSFRRPLFMAHYMIATVPALLLWGGSILTAMRERRVQLAVAVALVLATLPGARWWHTWGYEEDWRGAAQVLAPERTAPDAPVVTTLPRYASHPLNYYLRHSSLGEVTRRESALATGDTARVWLVVREFDIRLRTAELAALRDTLSRGRTVVERRQLRGVTMELYERPR